MNGMRRAHILIIAFSIMLLLTATPMLTAQDATGDTGDLSSPEDLTEEIAEAEKPSSEPEFVEEAETAPSDMPAEEVDVLENIPASETEPETIPELEAAVEKTADDVPDQVSEEDSPEKPTGETADAAEDEIPISDPTTDPEQVMTDKEPGLEDEMSTESVIDEQVEDRSTRDEIPSEVIGAEEEYMGLHGIETGPSTGEPAVQEEETKEIGPVMKTDRKVGGGLVLFSYFMGLHAYFDFTLPPGSSDTIHTQIIIDSAAASSPGTTLSINRTFILATYRFPLSSFEGAYVGAGGGYGQSRMTYDSTDTATSYAASGGGLFGMGEFGLEKYWDWNVDRLVRVNAFISYGLYISYSDDYDETRISDRTNHREIVNTGWNASKEIIHLGMGFGGTF